jgi:hypothetical protein
MFVSSGVSNVLRKGLGSLRQSCCLHNKRPEFVPHLPTLPTLPAVTAPVLYCILWSRTLNTVPPGRQSFACAGSALCTIPASDFRATHPHMLFLRANRPHLSSLFATAMNTRYETYESQARPQLDRAKLVSCTPLFIDRGPRSPSQLKSMGLCRDRLFVALNSSPPFFNAVPSSCPTSTLSVWELPSC